MKFKPFQIHDYAAAAMVDGLVLAHDTGLGKSLAAAFPVKLSNQDRLARILQQL